MDKGRELFEKYNIPMTFDFRMSYGTGMASLIISSKEREESRKEDDSNKGSHSFPDYETINRDVIRMWKYIKDVIDKSEIKKELDENEIILRWHSNIWGSPSKPMPLSESDLRYDEYIELK